MKEKQSQQPEQSKNASTTTITTKETASKAEPKAEPKTHIIGKTYKLITNGREEILEVSRPTV